MHRELNTINTPLNHTDPSSTLKKPGYGKLILKSTVDYISRPSHLDGSNDIIACDLPCGAYKAARHSHMSVMI